MNSLEIRQKFFEFFKKHGHEQVSSSPLIPAQDPTLLFTNAGMNQFKDLFLGFETRSYKRAVTIQKCARAGGKHNDLDVVGFTKRHLTFFEMMGNFSFGDYFKKEAIQYAWDFLTQDIGLDQNSLYVTVFQDDQEAYDIWHKQIGVPTARIGKLGEKDNFWAMGDTGPCGPCTEIYIDRGMRFGCGATDCAPGCSCDRFLEIWNNVFMQFNRQADGTLEPLKQTGVDTGMGLERLCAVIENKDSVFETSIFQEIIQQIEQLTGIIYQKQTPELRAAFHVLADHIRAACFMLADGCSPSNEGRGYVLRKIIRRAALFEQKLTHKTIFPQLAESLINSMHPVYPELAASKKYITEVLESEINKFADNLIRGKQLLEKCFEKNQTHKLISGAEAFKLYDTFGFPLELISLIANERNFTVDLPAFEQHMEQQRVQSGQKSSQTEVELKLAENITTKFLGYQLTELTSQITALFVDHKSAPSAKAGDTVWLITPETPFFVACGGQVNDQGIIKIGTHSAKLLDLKKVNHALAIQIITPVDLALGQTIELLVDQELRLRTMKNHTATHLLQAALIELLGKSIKQSGSIVNPDYLRFDFTYHKNLTPEEIKWVEERVNRKIWENILVNIEYTTHKKALERGVIAIFGEKYNPEEVRVIDIPGFSAELCGGTHVRQTGDIGSFKITEVGALSAGNRRIFAVTGPAALELYQNNFNCLKELSQDFKVQPNEVLLTVKKQKEQLRKTEQLLQQARTTLWQAQIPTWLTNTVDYNAVPYLFLELNHSELSDLREIANKLVSQKPGLYFLVSKNLETQAIQFLVNLDKSLSTQISLKKLAAWLTDNFEMRGGGNELSLQGGGPKLDLNQLKISLTKALEQNLFI